MKIRSVLSTVAASAFLGLVITTQSGCLVAAAGAGAATYAYVNGEMSANMDAPVEQVAAAAKSAFEDMKAVIYENQPGGPEAKVYARTKEDRRVEVLIKGLTSNASKVSIRVDNFGNETVARDVLNRIERKIKG
jgi:hypothetical protein